MQPGEDMKFIGIDVGTSSIKILELLNSARGPQLSYFQEIPIGNNPAHDKELEILEALRSYSSGLNPDKVRIAMGLNQIEVVSRKLQFPFLERLKIQKSLPFELEEEIPFNLETAIFDYKTIQTEGGQTQVLGAAVPKNFVDKVVRLASDSGLDVSVLSSEGFALANLAETSAPSGPDHLIAQLHIGHTHTNLNFFLSGRLVGLRFITFGMKELISLVVKKYEMPWVEAKKEFEEKASLLIYREGATYEQLNFSDTLSQGLKPLYQELRLLLIEAETEFKKKVKSILMSGGGAQLGCLNAHLTMQLGLVCNPAPRPAVAGQAQFSGENYLRFSVALGLALEAMKRPRSPAVQFLRGDFAKQNRRFTLFWDKWGHYAKAGAVALVGFWILAEVRLVVTENLLSQAQEQLRKQARQTAGLSLKQASESALRNFLKEEKKKVDELKSLSKVQELPTSLDVLRKLSDVLPSRAQLKMNLTEVAVHGLRVEMIGTVQSQAELSLIENSLSKLSSKPVEKLTHNQTDLGSRLGFAYGITMKADLMGGSQ